MSDIRAVSSTKRGCPWHPCSTCASNTFASRCLQRNHPFCHYSVTRRPFALVPRKGRFPHMPAESMEGSLTFALVKIKHLRLAQLSLFSHEERMTVRQGQARGNPLQTESAEARRGCHLTSSSVRPSTRRSMRRSPLLHSTTPLCSVRCPLRHTGQGIGHDLLVSSACKSSCATAPCRLS